MFAQRIEACPQRISVETMIARLTLLTFDQDAGLFQSASVMAQEGERDTDSIGDVLAGALLAVGKKLHDLKSGCVAQSFEDFGTLGKIELAHSAMLPALLSLHKLDSCMTV